jgi:hypothetical protein
VALYRIQFWKCKGKKAESSVCSYCVFFPVMLSATLIWMPTTLTAVNGAAGRVGAVWHFLHPPMMAFSSNQKHYFVCVESLGMRVSFKRIPHTKEVLNG